VRPLAFEPSPTWLVGDAVFVSDEDLTDSERVVEWRGRIPVVVLTRGDRGCTVWDASGRHDVSGVAVEVRDPTGAGDVFAVSFLIRYAETRDVLQAGSFAAAAAALSVGGEGVNGLGTRNDVEKLLRSGRVQVA
jgi:sugar/nucleoside kinase (ribokinase family)